MSARSAFACASLRPRPGLLLCRWEGFRVDPSNGRVGTVEWVRFRSRGTVPTKSPSPPVSSLGSLFSSLSTQVDEILPEDERSRSERRRQPTPTSRRGGVCSSSFTAMRVRSPRTSRTRTPSASHSACSGTSDRGTRFLGRGARARRHGRGGAARRALLACVAPRRVPIDKGLR